TPTSNLSLKKPRKGNKNLPDIKFVNKTVHKITPENPVIDIPSFLTYIHKTYGVSYRYIAEVLGISSTYLSYLRRGLRRPTPQVIQRLSNIVAPQELFSSDILIISNSFFATSIKGNNMVAGKYTLKEAAYHFLIAKQAEGKSDATIKFYRENLERIFWWFRTYSPVQYIGDVVVQQLREFFVYLATEKNRWGIGSTSSRKPASKSTIDAYWRTLQSFFTWLVNEEILDQNQNPMKKIPRPKVSSKIIKDIPLKVIKEVLEKCGHNSFTLVRNRAIIMVLLDTGVRLGALSRIKLRDIDHETGLITVLEKGDKLNLVHLNVTAMSYLKVYLEIRKEYTCEFLWVNQDGRRMQKSAIQIMIRRLKKYGGDYRWTPHTFRNTWAINLLRNGSDVFSLQVLGGWVDLDMPRRYTRAMNIEDAVRAHKKASPADRLAEL
ncbi:MAG: hypothetical protein A2158_08395, partial [Chloroflexi bacterium RBG_13_46_14]